MPALIVGLALLAGCDNPPRTDDGQPSTGVVEKVTIDYADLSARYNRRVEWVDQMWARAVVEIDYVDAEGKGHFEQGDGVLMVRKPGELALSIGKLGEIFLWLGADAERFWWMELKPGDGREPTAYVGRNAQIKPGDAAPGNGPLPVGPDQLIALLGLTPIPGAEESHPEAEAVDGGKRAWVVTPLGETKGVNPAMHTLIDVATARPVQVDVTDAKGDVVVTAKLERYELMQRDGVPPGGWPMVSTRVEITASARKGRLVLFLSELTDGKERDKIKDAQFDFERLVQMLGVQRVRVLREANP